MRINQSINHPLTMNKVTQGFVIAASVAILFEFGERKIVQHQLSNQLKRQEYIRRCDALKTNKYSTPDAYFKCLEVYGL